MELKIGKLFAYILAFLFWVAAVIFLDTIARILAMFVFFLGFALCVVFIFGEK